MSKTKIELENQKIYFECEIDVNIVYQVFPDRVEDFFGIHYFDEKDELKKELVQARLICGLGKTIDITDRLTKEEKELMLKAWFE